MVKVGNSSDIDDITAITIIGNACDIDYHDLSGFHTDFFGGGGKKTCA